MKKFMIGLVIGMSLILTACVSESKESPEVQTQEIEQSSVGENCNH